MLFSLHKEGAWMQDNKFRNLFSKSFGSKQLVVLRFVAVYALIGVLWNIFSEQLLSFLDNVVFIDYVSKYFFVFISACFFYVFLIRVIKEEEKFLILPTEEFKRTYRNSKESQQKFRKAAERYELALSGTNYIIWDWDIQEDKMYFSEQLKEVLGYDDSMGFDYKTVVNLIHPDDREHSIKTLEDYLLGKTSSFECEHRVKTKSGEYIWMMSHGRAIWDDDGRPLRIAGFHSDITERKMWEAKTYKMAFYDSLTELPNRALFMEKLGAALKKAYEENSMVSIMLLDLDNFRTINETIGHDAGDQLLKSVGILLQRFVREAGTIARLEGDEFVILQPNVTNIEEVTHIAESIIHSLQQPWIMDNKEFYITASIGIGVYPYHGSDVNTLLKNADTAMYRAKNYGKNTYQLFDQQMNTDILERLELESYLRHALKRNEFFLVYQPQIDTKTGLVVGAEALIRWAHPLKGVLSPIYFIPMAEETGLIISIGEWVLYTACKQNKAFQDAGLPPIRVAVNISGRQLQHPDFLDMVKRTLEQTGLDPCWLELEITETVVMSDLNHTISILNKLKDMGIHVSLDDFGTGYSSLNYLKRLPINALKMDKSFVDGIAASNNEESIAKGLILLAHSMNLSVVAEGIETQEQYEFIKRQKCDKVQGYLFGKPMPPEEFARML